jgi:hypothetical protein
MPQGEAILSVLNHQDLFTLKMQTATTNLRASTGLKNLYLSLPVNTDTE